MHDNRAEICVHHGHRHELVARYFLNRDEQKDYQARRRLESMKGRRHLITALAKRQANFCQLMRPSFKKLQTVLVVKAGVSLAQYKD